MLITYEEEKRLQSIERESKADDTRWLCQVVRKLLCLKITEFDFPLYAAHIDLKRTSAQALLRKGPVAVEQESLFSEFGRTNPTQILSYTFEASICEYLMCVRPYIRVVSPCTQEMLDRLARNARVDVSVNGTRILDGGSAEEHLMGLDGYGLRRLPFAFQAPSSDPSVLRAGILDEHQWAAVSERHGIILPPGTPLAVSLSGVDLKAGEKLVISTGLVAAKYTSEGAPGR